MMKNKSGIFCISLDFELYWGIRDKKTIEEYGENVLGAWKVVPKLLELFKRNSIHATWAIVGAMMCENYEDLVHKSPEILPEYSEEVLSPYKEFYSEISAVPSDYLFGKQLVDLVQKTPFQELGTHTFSHYYCLENGQTRESFLSDLQAAIAISKENDFTPNSLIFPRHQLNSNYIKEIPNYGIEIYRGTEKIWYNSSSPGNEEGVLKRAIRFADYYFPMFSQHIQDLKEVKNNNLYQIRASRWLRPYSKKWEKLDFLKMKRIKSQMTSAAKQGKIFQLWFHPHDIGADIEKNFEYLEKIMNHYQVLKSQYGFESLHFTEIKEKYDAAYSL